MDRTGSDGRRPSNRHPARQDQAWLPRVKEQERVGTRSGFVRRAKSDGRKAVMAWKEEGGRSG